MCEDLLWLKEKDDKLTADMNLRDFGEDESAAAMTQFLLQRKAKYQASCRSKFHDKRRKLSSKVSDNCPSQHLTHPHQDPSCLLSTTPTRSQETTPHRQNATHSTPTSSRRMPWSFASTPDIGLTPDIGMSVTVSSPIRRDTKQIEKLIFEQLIEWMNRENVRFYSSSEVVSNFKRMLEDSLRPDEMPVLKKIDEKCKTSFYDMLQQ